MRFGIAAEVLVAGEEIETVLSLKSVMPALPMVATLSAANLAALLFPRALKRLYVACDADIAGCRAFERLAKRAQAEGIHVLPMKPIRADFNDDLVALGAATLWRSSRVRSPPRTS